MEEELNANGIEEEYDENSSGEDQEKYVEAVTFPIDESWPEEIKKQVAQLNEMSAIINSEAEESTEVEEEDNSDGDIDEEDIDEEEVDVPEEVVSNISSEETQTFGDLF